jgi:hypothetical protein
MLRGCEGPRSDATIASDPVAPSHFLTLHPRTAVFHMAKFVRPDADARAAAAAKMMRLRSQRMAKEAEDAAKAAAGKLEAATKTRTRAARS